MESFTFFSEDMAADFRNLAEIIGQGLAKPDSILLAEVIRNPATPIAIMAGLLLAEVFRQLTRRQRIYTLRETLATLLMLAVNFAIASAIFKSSFFKSYLDFLVNFWNAHASHGANDGFLLSALKFTTGLLYADLMIYWIHRLVHVTKIGWCFHEGHHQSKDFNVLVTPRNSFIYFVAFSAVLLPLMSPLILLGLTLSDASLVIATINIWVVFQHNRVVGRMPRIFEAVLVTPTHHKVHHSSRLEHHDCNFGSLFIFWDYVFGTFKREEAAEPVFGAVGVVDSINPLVLIANPFKYFFSEERRHAFDRIFSRVRRTLDFSRKDAMRIGVAAGVAVSVAFLPLDPQGMLTCFLLLAFVGDALNRLSLSRP